SPNQAVDTSLYPDDTSRQIAEALVNAETFRFDMSDLTPSAFGGTEGQGEWQIMIQFLSDPSDIQGTQQALEDAAAAASKEPGAPSVRPVRRGAGRAHGPPVSGDL